MQAARGTPLTPSTPEDTTDPAGSGAVVRGRARSGVLLIGFTVSVAMWVLDQVTKYLAVRELSDREPVEVFGHWVRLTLLRNPGAAFSTGTGFTKQISILAIVAFCVVLWLLLFRVQHRGWALAFGFLLAGVGGNLTDRLFRQPGPLRGHVIDMVQFPNWPVFNVADVSIDIAAGIFILLVVRGIRLDGTRHTGDDD